MRVIVAGSRSITDYSVVKCAIEASGFGITVVVSGAAKGVDTLGEQWALDNGIPIKSFPAKWNDLAAPNAVIKTRRDGTKYNVRAGFDRNCEMAAYADALVAVWDGCSTGTAHCIENMRKLGKKVFVFRCSE